MNNKGCRHQRIIYSNKPEFSYILGALMGDGSIQRYESHLCCKDEDFADKFKKMGDAINLRALKRRRYEDGRFKYFTVALNSRWLYSIISDAVIGKDFINIQFINGFFDAEGSAMFYRYKNKNMKRFVFYNTDLVLLKKIKDYLFRNGIESKFYRVVIPKKDFIKASRRFVNRNELFLYQLKICNEKSSMLKFCEMFSFSIKRKEEARKKIKKYYEEMKEPIRVCRSCGVFTYHYAHDLCEKCYKKANRKKMIAYLRKYYRLNKDVLLPKQKRYYRRNAERIAVRGKIYYRSHKEQYAKVMRNYYLRNRLKINAYQRGWRRKRRALLRK